MNIKKPHFFFMLLLITAVSTALLLSLGNSLPHNAYAYGRQVGDRAGYAQAQPTPRNIFVGTSCEEPAAGDSPPREHIRFGSETSHYFKFLGKGGDWYRISTKIISTDADSVSIDTKLLLFRRNPVDHPGQQPIAENDDKPLPVVEEGEDPPAPVPAPERYESQLNFLATADGDYWIEVQNLVGEGRGSYCLQIEVAPSDLDARADVCEFNNSIETACEIEVKFLAVGGEVTATYDPNDPVPTSEGSHLYNFHPPVGQGIDLDFYKIWVKAGQHYVCQTHDLSLGNDTNMIFYRGDGSDFVPNKGNDDIDTPSGNKASRVDVVVDYTGWLNILVNPVVEVDYQHANRYSYRLTCFLTPTIAEADEADTEAEAGASADTEAGNPGSSGSGAAAGGASEAVSAAAPGSGTPQPAAANGDAAAAAPAAQATPTAPAPDGPTAVSFVALPAAVPTPPAAQSGQPVSFTVQIYYDANDNGVKEDGEGVAKMPVYLHTGLSETPVRGTTTDGGAIFFSTETAGGQVELIVPYLNVNHDLSVSGVHDVRLRIAP